jgi:O-antigen/teichoic acid export membrane protein
VALTQHRVGARLRGLRSDPVAVVLAGRLAAQFGVFLHVFVPLLVLGTDEANRLAFTATIAALAVIAPAVAVHMHFIRQDDRPDLARVGARVTVALGAVGTLAGGAVIAATVGLRSWAWIYLLGSVVAALVSWSASLLARRRRFVVSAAIEASSGVALSAAAVVGWWLFRTPWSWTLSYVVAWCAVALCAAVLVGRTPAGGDVDEVVSPELATPRVPAPRGWRPAATMMAQGWVAMAFNRLDYLVLGSIGDPAQAVRYLAASRLVGPMLIALGSLNNSLYVRLIELRDRPAEALRVARRFGVRFAGLAGVAGALLTAAVAVASWRVDSIGRLDVVVVVALLSVALVPYAAVIPVGFFLNAMGQERRWLLALALATLVDLVLVATFASSGATATALAWVATQATLFAIVAVVVRHGRGAPPHPTPLYRRRT